jgi:hypothetical protein
VPVTTNKGRLETSDITKRTVRAGIALLATVAVLVPVTPAAAIRNGEPDTAHPGVGLIRFTHAGDVPRNDRDWCTGTLIADRVVLTAVHCIFDIERSDFFVTFSPRLLNNPLVDPSVAGDYLLGTPYADPRLGEGQVRADDAARSRSRPGTRSGPGAFCGHDRNRVVFVSNCRWLLGSWPLSQRTIGHQDPMRYPMTALHGPL